MSNGEDLYYVIAAVNVELQNILSLLLDIYADVHALTNLPAAGTNALCSLLSSDFDLLKIIVKDYVSGKLYTSEDKTAVLPDVDSKKFDSSLLLDILIKVLLTKYLNGNCSKCGGVCCPDCIHSENSCIRCRNNDRKPTENCWHKCKKCKKFAKACSKTICCITCNTCLNCNKDIVTAILNDPSDCEEKNCERCEWFLLTHSLHLSTLFRKLFAHVTVHECEKFTTGILTPLSENLQIFQICGNLPQLQNYVTFIFNNLVEHAEVKRLQLPSHLSGQFDGVLKAMDRLKFILEHSVPQEKYLQYLEKAKKIFIEDNKEFYETLKFAESRILKAIDEKKEEIIASNKENKKELKDHVTEIGDTNTGKIMDKLETLTVLLSTFPHTEAVYQVNNRNNRSDIEEEPRTVSSVTLFQHFDKGFVLEMPIEKDRKIEKVEYKYKDESWIEVEAGRKIINGIIYLRVQKIKSTGKHQVRVISYLGGVKREDPLVVDVQKLLDKETDFLFTVTPPSEVVPLLHQHWKKAGIRVEDRTNLMFTVFDSSDSEDDEQHEKMSDAKKFSYLGVGYLNRNHINFDKVLKFPPSSMIKDGRVKNIRETFSGLLKDEIGLRAMISNYADFKYFHFIHDDTEKAYVETSLSDVPSENRLLLFCSELSTIASIRIINDKRKILEEMNNCFEDLKSFCYTFKRLIDGNIILTILLVCCEISREEIKEEIKFYFNKEFEKRIKFFFLTKDEFGYDGNSLLEYWWKDIFKHKLHKILKNHPPLDREKTEEMFKKILGQCMATIAWCDRESKSRLPTLSPDQHLQILTLLLSDSQLNAIHGPEKKKFICGPFGSGKTIVAECLVRLIYENSQKEDNTKMKTLIVYAIQDNHSLLEVRNKRFVDRLKKVLRKKRGDDHEDDKVIIKSGTFCSLTGLDDGKSLLDFVEDVLEKEKEFSNVNFVLDEVSHESIEGEGDLKELKKKLENLKMIDHFIIFPRSANLQVQLAGKNKPNESYLYKLFPDDNKYRLEVVMRNSIEIVKAAESCQKSVGPTKSVCKIPVTFHNDDLKNKTVMSIPNAVLSLNLEIENPAENSKQENDDPNGVSSGSPEIENPKEGNEGSNSVSTENPKDNKENNPAVATNGAEEKESFEPVNKNTTFQSNSLQAAKEITKENEKPETFETLEFKTSFIKCIPGNKVSNGTPKLINLPLKFDKCSDNGAKILSLILDKICLVKFSKSDSPGRSNDIRSPIIICNEMDEVEITYYALSLIKRLEDCCRVYVPQLQRTSYPFNKKEKIYDEIIYDKKILIVDNSSFRGMESQHVITFYNPLEEFDRHLLPEIMTRATVSLDIIAFRVDNDTAGVVSNWMGEDMKEERKLVNVINVNTLPDRNVENLYALEKEELKIYGQSEDFEEYFRDSVTFNKFKEQNKEEFRISQGPNNSSDYLKKISSESKDTLSRRGGDSGLDLQIGNAWDQHHAAAYEQNTLQSNSTPVIKTPLQQQPDNLNFGSSTTSPRDVERTSSDAIQEPNFPNLPNFTITKEEVGLTHIGDLAEADMRKIRSLALIELTALFDAYGISMNKRKTPMKLKLKDKGTFGVALTALCAREESKNNNPGVPVPRIFKEMLEYIEKNGLHEPGLLSVPGSTTRVKAFKEEADKNPDLSTLKLEEQRITDVTTCLKQFLRDLPVPLLSCEYQNTFTSVSDLPDRKVQLQALNLLVLLLHPVHRETLKLLLSFLNKVVINESHNKMSLNYVAIIMAPNLFFNNNAKINIKEAQKAADMADVLRVLIRYQEIIWTIPEFMVSQIRFLYDAGAKKNDPKGVRKLITSKKIDHSASSVGNNGEELEDFDENLIIRVKAPTLNKQSMPIQLSKFTTVAEIITKFQWQREKSNKEEDEFATDRLRINATNKLDVKKDGDNDNDVKFFLYEVGGNIGERRLEASARISAILKENPNAEWVLKSEPV